jgi:predicted nucleic acid-binding protein
MVERRVRSGIWHVERPPSPRLPIVLVETYALLGRRIGLAAMKAFRNDIRPLLDIMWVDESLHERALDLLFDRNVRELSLVDAVSFITMRDRTSARLLPSTHTSSRKGSI